MFIIFYFCWEIDIYFIFKRHWGKKNKCIVENRKSFFHCCVVNGVIWGVCKIESMIFKDVLRPRDKTITLWMRTHDVDCKMAWKIANSLLHIFHSIEKKKNVNNKTKKVEKYVKTICRELWRYDVRFIACNQLVSGEEKKRWILWNGNERDVVKLSRLFFPSTILFFNFFFLTEHCNDDAHTK